MSAIPEHLRPARYKIHCRCLRCGHQYSYTTTKITGTDKPCPKKACKEAAVAEERVRMEENIRRMIESERAPGVVGANTTVKAIDETAKIVMEDHHLTDLRDNVKVGESAAPKLPPHQQARADAFFGGGVRKPNPAMAQQISLMGARAMAGSFAPPQGGHITDYALRPDIGPELKPKIKIVAG